MRSIGQTARNIPKFFYFQLLVAAGIADDHNRSVAAVGNIHIGVLNVYLTSGRLFLIILLPLSFM